MKQNKFTRQFCWLLKYFAIRFSSASYPGEGQVTTFITPTSQVWPDSLWSQRNWIGHFWATCHGDLEAVINIAIRRVNHDLVILPCEMVGLVDDTEQNTIRLVLASHC